MKIEKIFSINKLLLIIAICFMGCSDSDDNSSTSSIPPIDGEATFAGDYVGFWTSYVTSHFKHDARDVSARLQGNEDVLFGSFFISTDFTACCNDDIDDGTISFGFDGNTITSFRYIRSGGCFGSFAGSSDLFEGTGVGEIRDDGALLIRFTGRDCDGIHDFGSIVLRKK